MNRTDSITLEGRDFPADTVAGKLRITVTPEGGESIVTDVDVAADATSVNFSFETAANTFYSLAHQRLDGNGEPLGDAVAITWAEPDVPGTVTITIPILASVALRMGMRWKWR